MEFNQLDAAAKELIWDGPATWLERIGIDPSPGVAVVDSDATKVTAASDKVIKVLGERSFLVDLEPHSYYDNEVDRKLWLRQVVLDHRHNLPVLSVLVLLHKRANAPNLTGIYERRLPDGRLTTEYHYHVVRLWQEDPESYLNAGVSVVPLVPLTNVSEADLPRLIDRMGERINAEPRPRAANLWLATLLLMGLRYPREQASHLLEGVMDMVTGSSTYDWILEQGHEKGEYDGRLKEARRLLLRIGTVKLGEPDASILTAVEAIQDVERLEALGERLVRLNVQNWSDLLQSS